MHNCLNPRRTNTYEISETDEQTDLPQKLQKRNTRQYQELTDSTDAWWRSPLTCEDKKLPEEEKVPQVFHQLDIHTNLIHLVEGTIEIIGELDDRLGDIQSDLEEIVERLK